MIAFVQQESCVFWNAQIKKWINELVVLGQPGWTIGDLLDIMRNDDALRLTVLRSSHTRGKGLPDIELRHIWVSMN
jgi:hypothetical protein